jgi:RNA polymerase sigma-70 factor (ECF subfamily)
MTAPAKAWATERAHWLASHVLPHEPALRAWLGRRPAAGLEVDDIIQETYAMLVGLTGVEHIASPRAYAFRAAQSLILQAARRRRIVRIETTGDIERLARASDEPSPERQVSARQELRQIADSIASLPARCCEAFTLRKIEGMSQRDVARRMGISEGAVEKHVGRARQSVLHATP